MALEMQHRSIRERLESFRSQEMHGITTLKQLMTLQSLDDCFYIWHRGQVGTINCFRLLRHPLLQQVESCEIGAALGEVAHLLHALDPKHARFNVIPMGSFSKILASNQRTTYNLYADDAFSLLPRRSFNHAVKLLLSFFEELTDLMRKKDPALCRLYASSRRSQAEERRPLQFDDETMCSKITMLLVDLKWAIAFDARHGAHQLIVEALQDGTNN